MTVSPLEDARAGGTTHQLDRDIVHYCWDNSIPPRLEIDSGDTVVFRCRDAADGFYTWSSTTADVMERVSKGHPLTGPVYVRGAQPGDVLQVEILSLVPGEIGFTQFRPDRGLLTDDFPEPYLKIWDIANGEYGELKPGVRVPLEPFLGVMGVALDEAGEYVTAPPRKNGGNMDVKQLTAGTTLYLPIWVDGALFSCGDGHAAQGDGEVCITAIETSMTATLRFTLRRDFSLEEPEFMTGGPLSPKTNVGPHYATTGIAPDLMEATKKAVRAMIGYLVRERGLTREEAYALSSVAVDLKVSEVVDAPNWVVTAFVPLSLFAS
ncbi:MAG: acetamidase/formamidase family protein [Chloroflexi bacterium]|nr:acetamidase/formamidase family protein [Chloroflexota bacterium]